jgi:hypothetical protein
MGEIKSTLELALERTRKISISEEEKEEILQKEIAKKASGMFHRYMEDVLSLHEIKREIERMEERTGRAIGEILLAQWMDAISLDGRNDKLLDGIEFLKGRSVDGPRQSLERLQSECQRERQQGEEKIRTRLADALKEKGIHGDAVVPHVEVSPEWRSMLETTQQTFQGRVEEVKETLKKL